MGHTIRKNDDKNISTFNFALTINSNLLKNKIEKSTKCREKKNRPNKNVSNAYLYTY